MSITIPTYGADGQRLRNYPLRSIEWMLSLDEVVVQRNRKGSIVCAHLRAEGGALTILDSAYMGQHYSFDERLPSGRSAWRHSPLLQRADRKNLMSEGFNSEQVDRFVRRTFRAVPLSCMSRTRLEGPPTPAKVVSIDSFRKRGLENSRPVEFDSENRRAA